MFTSTGQVEYSGSGTIGALNGAVTVPIPAFSMLLLAVSGTWSATLTFEASVDGTTFLPVPACIVPAATSVSTTTSNGTYGIAVGGYNSFRVRASAYTSGTSTVTWNADSNTNPTFSPHTLNGATDGTTIGNVSDSLKTSAIQSGTWNITNVSGTVSLPTGASTAANQSTMITSIQILDDVPSAQNGSFVKGNPMMGQLDDTSTVVATEDNVSVARITAQRSLHVNLRNVAGTEIATSSNPLRVDPTGTTNQPILLKDASGISITALNGNIPVSDLSNGGGSAGAITVGTSALLANVSGTNLANRKYLSIFNNGSVTIYWGTANTVTTSSGTPIFKNQFISFAVGAITNIYLISGTASQNIRIGELI